MTRRRARRWVGSAPREVRAEERGRRSGGRRPEAVVVSYLNIKLSGWLSCRDAARGSSAKALSAAGPPSVVAVGLDEEGGALAGEHRVTHVRAVAMRAQHVRSRGA